MANQQDNSEQTNLDISGKDGPQPSVKTEPQVIPPGLEPVLRAVGANPQDPSFKLAVELSLGMYRGPLPPPPILAEFEKVQPGIVQKLIGWTEDQAAHRKSLEVLRTTGDDKRKTRGQLIAAGVSFFGLTLSAVVGIWGNPYVASVLAIVAVGGPLAAIVLALGFNMNPKKPELPKPSTEAPAAKQEVTTAPDSPPTPPTTIAT